MDRVGVIRRLAIGDTLIQSEGEWKIDLTKFRHKTSKFYGVFFVVLSLFCHCWLLLMMLNVKWCRPLYYDAQLSRQRDA